MRIYLASSWRNEKQPSMVETLRVLGHKVYDFRNPAPGNSGFHWSDVDPEWQQWSASQFRNALEHPSAVRGSSLDLGGLRWCDAVVLLLPCGKSAHLELGWGVGAGRLTAVMGSEGFEPELMYSLCDLVTDNLQELVELLRRG